MQNHCRSVFRFDLQNELIPNQPNVTVKAAATASRDAVAFPASYFKYSRTRVTAPKTAIARKSVPVTSSHN
jgi:hypothetical protein